MSTISAGTTTTTALVSTGDTTGNLVLATGSVPTTALTLNSTTQAATFAGAVTAPSVTTTGSVNVPNTFAYKNKLINGNFDIWQRGTSVTITTSGIAAADRWQYLTDGTLSTGSVFTQQAFTVGQTAVPNNPTYFLQAVYTSVNTPSNYIRQRIENVSTLSGQTATFSFWARTTSGTIAISSQFQQEFGTGGSPSSGIYGIGSTPFTATTTWQQFTMTTTIPSISGKTIGTNNDSALNAAIIFPVSGASGTIQIAQAQVELGSQATSFDIRFLGTELAMCQRYYLRVTGNSNAFARFGTGVCSAPTNVDGWLVPLPVTMRALPSATFSNVGLYNGASTGVITVLNNYSTPNSLNGTGPVTLSTGAPFATGNFIELYAITSSSYIEANAEL
jgi:hypothetical protein